ncbi:MAG TPA: hypothetical protein VHO06_24200 [Polyangia bacterium]|nr:hypothetical protein [Polyangia bacterium]
MSTESSKGPPLFGLPLGGVLFGLLWTAGAFFSLFYCFFGTNYFAPEPVPAKELAISNAAFAGEAAAEAAAPRHEAPATPQP